MSSLLLLFFFQSGDSPGEESEESSRSDEKVEKFVWSFISTGGVKMKIFERVRLEWQENFLTESSETFIAPKA
jgi:hypothetical protein